MKKLFICNLSNFKNYFVKYIDEIRDEIIVFKFNYELPIKRPRFSTRDRHLFKIKVNK